MSDTSFHAALLSAIGQFANFLLDAEADAICGVPRHIQSRKRINYRSGYHARRLRLRVGDVPVRVPNLRYPHLRPGMCKRFKRLEPFLVDTLSAALCNGTQMPRIAALVQQLWTVELPPALHAGLTAKAITFLEEAHCEFVATANINVRSNFPIGQSIPRPHAQAAHATQSGQPAPRGYSVY